MNKAKLIQLMVAIIMTFLSAKSGMAESSKELALMGRETWSAFICSALAENSNDFKEQERLFTFGYKQGLKFIDALKSEKIKKEDISNEVPMGVLMRLEGPTPDFMLGRVNEAALESVVENVFNAGETFKLDKAREATAKKEFRKRNCQLIGKKYDIK